MKLLLEPQDFEATLYNLGIALEAVCKIIVDPENSETQENARDAAHLIHQEVKRFNEMARVLKGEQLP